MPRIAKLNDKYYFNFNDLCLYRIDDNGEDEQVEEITGLSLELLQLLCKNPKNCIEKKTIKKEVWGYSDISDDRLRYEIHILQNKLNKAEKGLGKTIIQNKRGRGYIYNGGRVEDISDDEQESNNKGKTAYDITPPPNGDEPLDTACLEEIETETTHKVPSAAVAGVKGDDKGNTNNFAKLNYELKNCDDGDDALELMAEIVNEHVKNLEVIQGRLDNAVKKGDAVWEGIYTKQLSINQDQLTRAIKKYHEMREELESKLEQIKGTRYESISYPSPSSHGALLAPMSVDILDIDDVDVDGFMSWYAGYMDEYEQLNDMISDYEHKVESVAQGMHDTGLEAGPDEIIDNNEDDSEGEGTFPKKTLIYVLVAAIVIVLLALGLNKIIPRTPSDNTVTNNVVTNTNDGTNEDPFGTLPESVKKYTYEDAMERFPKSMFSTLGNAGYGNYVAHETEQLMIDIKSLHDKIVYEMEKPASTGGEESWSRTVFKKMFDDYYQALISTAEAEYEKEAIAIDMEFEGGTGAGPEKMLKRYIIYQNVLQELEYRYELVRQMQ